MAQAQTRTRSQATESSQRVFKLFQKFREVKIEDPDGPDGNGEPLKLLMWKPTDDENREAQMYLVDRLGYWETEDTRVADRVQSFLISLGEDKELLVSMILDQTLAQKIAENTDLIPPEAKAVIEHDALINFTLADFQRLWTVRPGLEANLEDVLRTSQQRTVEQILPFLVKGELFAQTFDGTITRAVEARFKAVEREKYMQNDAQALKAALATVNRRTVAYGLALEDWTRKMTVLITRESKPEGGKGPRVFSDDPEAANYVGEVAPEVLKLLGDNLAEVLNMGRLSALRKVLDDPGFKNSAGLPNDSDNPLPAAGGVVITVPLPTPQSTPST